MLCLESFSREIIEAKDRGLSNIEQKDNVKNLKCTVYIISEIVSHRMTSCKI